MARKPLTQPNRRKLGSYGRRYIDRKWPRHARDFWLLVLSVIIALTLVRVSSNQTANTHALCRLRHELQQRVNQGEAFLGNHPDGFAGVSSAAIQTSIESEQATVRSLASLRC